MANTYGTFTGSGGTTSFAIPFTNWLNDSHVIVRVAGVNYDINSSETAYDFSVSNGNVVFDTAPDGVFFYILRDTLGKDHDDTALLYDFVDGSILTSDQQDDVYRQTLYLAQEAAEQAPIVREYVYDSGWVDNWNGTSLAANAFDTVTLPASVKDYFPFDVVIWGRSSLATDTVYRINAPTSGSVSNSVGIQVQYDTSTGGLLLYLQDNAIYHEVVSGSGTVGSWSSIDEIRVVIPR